MFGKHQSPCQSDIREFPSTQDQRLRLAIAEVAKGNHAVAFTQLVSLADDGCVDAYGFVGAYYEQGVSSLNVAKDYDKARYYFEQSITQCGSREGYLSLARLYYFGRGVERDYCKAFECYDFVTKEFQDSGVAYLMLGQMYQHGQCVDKDLDKAEEYYRRAWNKGYVLGFTHLGKLTQERGHNVRGWMYRLKAGIAAYRIAGRDPHDSRLRSC